MFEPKTTPIGWLLLTILVVYFVSAPGAQKRSELADIMREETYSELQHPQTMPLENTDHFWQGQCQLTLLHPQDFDFNPVLKRECQRIGIIK